MLSNWFTLEGLLPLLAAVLGFLGKSVWDVLTKRRESLRDLQIRSKIQYLEKQLSEFYWPIYLRLIQNEATWEHLFDSTHTQAGGSKLQSSFEKEIILPNHEAIVARIQNSAHLADADHAFREMIAEYLHHVALYQTLRAAGDDRLPAQLKAPWPQGLNKEFEKRTLMLQQKYDELLERSGSVTANPNAESMFRDLEQEGEEIAKAMGLPPRDPKELSTRVDQPKDSS